MTPRPFTKPLSDRHRAELQTLVERGRELLVDHTGTLPCLERVLGDVRRGDATREALSLVAFVFADEVIARAQWSWCSLSADGSLNPAIVSPTRSHACVPVDCVLGLLSPDAEGRLTALYRQICDGTLPAAEPKALQLIG